MCCLSVQYMILPCCCDVLSLWLGKLGLMFGISGLLGTLLLCDSCNCLSYILCCCLCSILFCCDLIWFVSCLACICNLFLLYFCLVFYVVCSWVGSMCLASWGIDYQCLMLHVCCMVDWTMWCFFFFCFSVCCFSCYCLWVLVCTLICSYIHFFWGRLGKQFLNLLDTCFPSTNKLHKILNRNTVKISYKCMPNMKQIISNHNKTILNKDNNTECKTNNCNCRIKEACPVNQKCQTSSLIYQATVTRHHNNKEESYIGLTDNTFKTRYNGHTSSFRNEQYRNATTLSNYIWTLKDRNINYSLKWKIIDRGRAYQPSGKNCGLCDLEKFYIISRPELASLNQRNELATSCRHRKKHLLCNK